VKIPNFHLTDFTTVIGDAWPFLAAGVATLTAALLAVAYLTRRGGTRKKKMSLENKLTFIVAVIIAGVCAQGMGKFFYDKEDGLGFPLELVIVVGGVLELTAFTCALRARRNIRDPEIGKAGVDGIAVWVVTALSGIFSAMEADKTPVQLFRLVMPLLAAWLWERGMSIERRKVRGGSTLNLRVTPERVLVWLRIAEPSGRTASEVDAHRRLTRVAKAAAKLRALRVSEAWDWRVAWAERRLERAMRSAVAHAGLAQDPARQQALIAQLGSIYNADALASLTPQAPWEGFTSLVQRTGFAVQGHRFTPVEFTSRPQVRVEIEEPVQEPVRDRSRGEVQGPVRSEVQAEVRGADDCLVREPGTAPEGEEPANQVREPAAPRTTPKHAKTRTTRTPNLPERKTAEVQKVVNLIRELGYDNVTLDVVQARLGFKKTTAYNRLTDARELVNQGANQKAVNQ
jgi:hypothetical protein